MRLCLFTLLLILLAPSLAAAKIVRFTDSQGVVHITTSEAAGAAARINPGPPGPDAEPRNPGNAAKKAAPVPASPPTPPPPPGNHPAVEPKALTESQTNPAPGRLSGPLGVIQIRTNDNGKIEASQVPLPTPVTPAPVSMASVAPLRVTPAAAVSPVPQALGGGIVRFKDHGGVIHITNEPPGPPAMQVATGTPETPPHPGPGPRSALQPVSWMPPDFGLRAAIADLAMASGETRIRRYRDRHGVLHIGNDAPPGGPAAPVAPVRLEVGQTGPNSERASPIRPPPAYAVIEAAGLPLPPLIGKPTVLAQRDRIGTLHIFNSPLGEAGPHAANPLAFLGKVNQGLEAIIQEAAQAYRLPTALILAVIRMESNFAPWAVSPKGAMGLMQLMPGTASDLGVRDPFCPRENILAGCRYLRWLLDNFQGSLPLAVAAYNAGHQRVVAAGYHIPPIKETQEFVTQVLGLYCLLEKTGRRL